MNEQATPGAASKLKDAVGELQEAVRSRDHLRPVGGGSKDALSGDGNLKLDKLSGILAYDPQEYTFSALAATPVEEVEAMLAKEGQALPFDPPLSEAGATLGGTVAAGLSGPGRYRYGGVRDFLLGVSFISGEGQLVTGGGKVVKNAAGFDLPKLMVGSLGRFGILTELTFKVFPVPESYTTLTAEFPDLEAALETMTKLALSPFELACLDLIPPATLQLRVGGMAEAAEEKLTRLQDLIGQTGDVTQGEDEAAIWQAARNFRWCEDRNLIKVPLNPQKVSELEAALETTGHKTKRRYSVGGNVAYLGWPAGEEKALNELLCGQGLSGLALTGDWQRPQLGKAQDNAFLERLLSVLDPDGKFKRDVEEVA